MKNKFILLTLLCFVFLSQAQVGIGTVNPGSTLTINGSLAVNYKIVTTNTILDITDYYVAYNSTSNGTITLPSAISGNGNFRGRIYSIKNTGTAVLTIAASGTELIHSETDVSSINVPAGYYVELISKGTTTGSTWELSMLANSTITDITTIGSTPYEVPQNSGPVSTFNVNDLGYVIVPNTSNTFTLPIAKPIFLNFALGIDDLTTPSGLSPYQRTELFLDGSPTGLFLIVQTNGVGYQLQVNISGVLNITAGTHTIDARMIRWFNNGVTSGSNQNFGTLSSVLSAVYLN